MFKIKENDIFAKNMSNAELYQMWKQLQAKQEKDLQNKIAQEFELFNECGFQYKEKAKEEMDKWLESLIKKNGTTEY